METKYYSQFGEDKILEKLFKKLGVVKGYFVDVGAHNGVYLSNTYRFVELGWDGINIEKEQKHIDKMKATLPERIKKVCVQIGPSDLTLLLDSFSVPTDFDLLSIDIDTYDYWVWNNLVLYDPKVVVIESNSRPGYYVHDLNDPTKKPGSSPASLKMLAIDKGYKEYAQVEGNLIFIRKDLYDHL